MVVNDKMSDENVIILRLRGVWIKMTIVKFGANVVNMASNDVKFAGSVVYFADSVVYFAGSVVLFIVKGVKSAWL